MLHEVANCFSDTNAGNPARYTPSLLQEPGNLAFYEYSFESFQADKWQENFNGVKWYSNGAYLEKRPIFTLDPHFHAGAYYVQEASSMFLAEAVRQVANSQQPIAALDYVLLRAANQRCWPVFCLSIAYFWPMKVIRSRYPILNYNLLKWGRANTHTSCLDSKVIAKLSNFFDLVLVDAPCSGEGLFRKDPKAVEEWSESSVQHCSARQKRILANAIQCLRPGGTLIYSTCTYNNPKTAIMPNGYVMNSHAVFAFRYC